MNPKRVRVVISQQTMSTRGYLKLLPNPRHAIVYKAIDLRRSRLQIQEGRFDLVRLGVPSALSPISPKCGCEDRRLSKCYVPHTVLYPTASL